jgi:hypothetical protein
MVGDRMDTDVVAGIEAGLETILVLSGVTSADQVERFPYRPTRMVGSVADLSRNSKHFRKGRHTADHGSSGRTELLHCAVHAPPICRVATLSRCSPPTRSQVASRP